MRISEDPASFREVYESMMGVVHAVRGGQLTVDQAEAAAKAGFTAAKALEADLHARMFEFRIATRGLPHVAQAAPLPGSTSRPAAGAA